MKLFPSMRSARARLTLWNVLVLALLLLALGITLRVRVEQNSLASIDENITSRARGSQWFWGRYFAGMRSGRIPLPRWGRGMQPPPERPPSQWQARMEELVFDLEGKRFFSSNKDPLLDPATFRRAAMGEQAYSIVKIEGMR